VYIALLLIEFSFNVLLIYGSTDAISEQLGARIQKIRRNMLHHSTEKVCRKLKVFGPPRGSGRGYKLAIKSLENSTGEVMW